MNSVKIKERVSMRDFVKMIQDELDEFVQWVSETQEFENEEEKYEYLEENFWSRTADEYGLEYDFDDNLVVGLIQKKGENHECSKFRRIGDDAENWQEFRNLVNNGSLIWTDGHE